MAADVRTQNGFEASEPRVLLTLPASTEVWDITGDLQRLLVATPAAEPKAPAPLSIVTNWTAGIPR